MNLAETLQQLPVGRKAKRLGILLPAIEQKLAEGISHKEILGLLNENGFELTERTYKSYLYRYRKRRRTTDQALIPVVHLINQTKFQAAGEMPANASARLVDSDQRPRTFEYDPSGLSPDLLK